MVVTVVVGGVAEWMGGRHRVGSWHQDCSYPAVTTRLLEACGARTVGAGPWQSNDSQCSPATHRPALPAAEMRVLYVRALGACPLRCMLLNTSRALQHAQQDPGGSSGWVGGEACSQAAGRDNSGCSGVMKSDTAQVTCSKAGDGLARD